MLVPVSERLCMESQLFNIDRFGTTTKKQDEITGLKCGVVWSVGKQTPNVE